MKSLILIAVLNIAVLFAILFHEKPTPAQAKIKPVCIEAHLGINKSESIVLCGTVVNL